MSFILEAQRRGEAAVDPTAAAQLAIDEDRRQRWRWALWLIALALIANVVILGYLFGPWNTADTLKSRQLVSNPNASRELVVKPRERTGPTVSPSSPPPSRAKTTPQPKPTSSATVAVPSAPATSTATAGKGRVLSPEQAAALNIQMDEAVDATATRSEDSAPVDPLMASDQSVAAQPEPPPQPSASAVKQTVTPKLDAPITLDQLSTKDRKDFPALEFSTHVYADDPALRAVVVNSRRLAEGENIGEVVLRAVTEDGIIVDYRGQRVAVSVMDTWQ